MLSIPTRPPALLFQEIDPNLRTVVTEKNRYHVARRDRNQSRKAVNDVSPVTIEFGGLRRRAVFVFGLRIKFELDPLSNAHADAVARRFEREAHASHRKTLFPKVEADEFSIVG